MDESSSAIPSGMAGRKPAWPWFSVLTSVFLWLLAWEAIVWFVPVQPRLVISTRDLEAETTEQLFGFSPDGRTLVNIVEDPNELGITYRLWDTRTGQDLGRIGDKEKNFWPTWFIADKETC